MRDRRYAIIAPRHRRRPILYYVRLGPGFMGAFAYKLPENKTTRLTARVLVRRPRKRVYRSDFYWPDTVYTAAVYRFFVLFFFVALYSLPRYTYTRRIITSVRINCYAYPSEIPFDFVHRTLNTWSGSQTECRPKRLYVSNRFVLETLAKRTVRSEQRNITNFDFFLNFVTYNIM